MGAKTWMIAYVEADAVSALSGAPMLDRAASRALAEKLFPDKRLEEIEDVTLGQTNPPDDELYVGCFPGVSFVAAGEFGIDHPSKLSRRFIDAAAGRRLYLHAMHSVVDWAAFAVWENGKLVRALSLSPDSGIIEDLGARLPFEEPFWAGQHAVEMDDPEAVDYPLPFHPLELAEEALFAFFGYRLEGPIDDADIEPENIPLCAFHCASRSPWWKPWA